MDLQSLVQYKKSKRRERAARMAEEPVSLLDDLDSAEEDTDLLKLKPQRPPRPKKVKDIEERLKDPLYEEDIVEGFSFCSFATYEDLDVSLSEKDFYIGHSDQHVCVACEIQAKEWTVRSPFLEFKYYLLSVQRSWIAYITDKKLLPLD